MQGKDRVGRRDSITNRNEVEVENNLPDQVEVPRSLAVAGEEIREITLHAFADASGQGLAAAVYAVVQQHSVVTPGLVAAKARLTKEDLTIPRLELVAGHMAANLLTSVRDALIGFPVKSLYAWLDSSVALHWIRGSGNISSLSATASARSERKVKAHGGMYRAKKTLQT